MPRSARESSSLPFRPLVWKGRGGTVTRSPRCAGGRLSGFKHSPRSDCKTLGITSTHCRINQRHPLTNESIEPRHHPGHGRPFGSSLRRDPANVGHVHLRPIETDFIPQIAVPLPPHLCRPSLAEVAKSNFELVITLRRGAFKRFLCFADQPGG